MSTSSFIDVTGLFTDGDGGIAEYDYCIPVKAIKDVVFDRQAEQTVVRYEAETGSISNLAVAEKYSVIVGKLRASGSVVS